MKRITIGVLLAMLLLAGCQKAQPEETTQPTKTVGGLSDLLQDYADTMTTASNEAP